MALQQLERVAVGRPITRVGVSLFPVYLPGSEPLDITSSSERLQVSELESASVPTLNATNLDQRPMLVLEGETVVGGQQNRTLNVSVLIPAGVTVQIPVSCVEAGRWNGHSRFDRGRTFATRRVRRTKQATVATNVHAFGRKETDQGAVWSTIGYELDRLDAESPSAALHAAEAIVDDRDNEIGASVEELVNRGPLPGQCGVVISHGSRIVGAEVLATSNLLEATWEPMVRAALLDTPYEPKGRPSATKALRFLERFATGKAIVADGVGLGREIHVRRSRLVGQALVLDERLVHASAFALGA